MSLGKFDPYSPGSGANTPSKSHGSPFPSVYSGVLDRSNGRPNPHHQSTGSKIEVESEAYFRQFVHVDRHPNGGASMVQMYQEEFDHLPSEQVEKLAHLFFQEVFSEETEGIPKHVIGIVHSAASYMPEIIGYMALTHPDLTVRTGHMRKSEIESVRMEEYASRVQASYSHGTFRCGPLLQLSIVGQVSEESGGYFPEFLGE